MTSVSPKTHSKFKDDMIIEQNSLVEFSKTTDLHKDM